MLMLHQQLLLLQQLRRAEHEERENVLLRRGVKKKIGIGHIMGRGLHRRKGKVGVAVEVEISKFLAAKSGLLPEKQSFVEILGFLR